MCRVVGPGERSLWGSGDLYIFRWSAKRDAEKKTKTCARPEVVDSRDHGHQGANIAAAAFRFRKWKLSDLLLVRVTNRKASTPGISTCAQPKAKMAEEG